MNAVMSGSWILLLMMLGGVAAAMGVRWRQNWLVWLGTVVFLVGAVCFLALTS